MIRLTKCWSCHHRSDCEAERGICLDEHDATLKRLSFVWMCAINIIECQHLVTILYMHHMAWRHWLSWCHHPTPLTGLHDVMASCNLNWKMIMEKCTIIILHLEHRIRQHLSPGHGNNMNITAATRACDGHLLCWPRPNRRLLSTAVPTLHLGADNQIKS